MINSAGTVIWECDVSAWNKTTFTLNWTINDAEGFTFHYIILGGSEVSAKLTLLASGTSTGNVAVTGVGFKPNCNILFHAGLSSLSIPNTNVHVEFGLGYVGNLGTERASFIGAWNAQTTMDTGRYQLNKVAIKSNPNDVSGYDLSHVSFDSDGYTVNVDDAPGASQPIIVLSLKGVWTSCGVFNKSTGGAPASQAVTGIGFQPTLLMLQSVMAVTSGTRDPHARFVLGASDGTNERCNTWKSEDGVANSNVVAIVKETKIIQISDNNSSVIQAEADLTSFDDDGFTLDWTINNGVATEIVYFALAGLSVFLDEDVDLTETLIREDVPIILLETIEPDFDTLSIIDIITILESLVLDETLEFLINDIILESLGMTDTIAEHLYLTEETLALLDVIDVSLTIEPTETLAMTDVLTFTINDFINETLSLTESIKMGYTIFEDVGLTEALSLKINQEINQETLGLIDSITVATTGSAGSVAPTVLFDAQDHDEFFVVNEIEEII